MGFARLFVLGIKERIRNRIDSIILLFPIYYTKLDKISLKSWFEVIEGNKKSLYKVRFISYIPKKFDKIILDMLFQMDYMNTEIIEKEAQLAVLRSIATRNKDRSMQFQADVLANELKKQKQAYETSKGMNLNAFIDYIEMTLECIGAINPEKITASRAFSLYQKAIERNKRLSELSKKR